MSGEESENLRTAVAAEPPLGTTATADQIAKSVPVLASELSEDITGQLLASDGGYTLGKYDAPLNQAIETE